MDRRGQFFPTHDDNPRSITPFITWLLIGINILVFLFTVFNLEHYVQVYGFTPADASVLTLFTSMFMHGGIAHIFGNMWFLFIFGDNVEERLGHWMYLAFYLLAGLTASLAHWAVSIGSEIPAVGASGAISGVLGAYLVFFPSARVYVTGGFGAGALSARMMLLLWFGFQFVSGVIGLFGAESGIAFFAHIGGFVFGVLVALLWRSITKNAPSTTK